jgi:hypothetical protein
MPLKKHNLCLILNSISAQEAISCVQCTCLIHLSCPAVTELTHDLLEDGLICEIDSQIAPCKADMCPTQPVSNSDTYHTSAVDIGRDAAIDTLLARGSPILHQEKLMSTGNEVKTLLDSRYKIISLWIERARQRMLGIAVDASGIVNFAGNIYCRSASETSAGSVFPL